MRAGIHRGSLQRTNRHVIYDHCSHIHNHYHNSADNHILHNHNNNNHHNIYSSYLHDNSYNTYSDDACTISVVIAAY